MYLLYIILGNFIYFGDYKYFIFDSNSTAIRDLNEAGWAIGGVLVGLGTKIGNGCTSGHGVCGIPRFSLRSIIAVLTFMSVGIFMSTIKYYYPYFNSGNDWGDTYYNAFRIIADVSICLIFAVYILVFVLVYRRNSAKEEKLDPLVSFASGVLFGLGLTFSGMLRRTKISAFLTLNSDWDPSLMFVMAAAIAINVPAFYWILKKNKFPVLAYRFEVPSNTNIDW